MTVPVVVIFDVVPDIAELLVSLSEVVHVPVNRFPSSPFRVAVKVNSKLTVGVRVDEDSSIE